MIRPLSIAALLLFVSACAAVPKRHTQILLGQDSYVSQGSNQPVFRKKGERFTVDKPLPVLVEAPGYASLLIPPLPKDSADMTVTLRPLQEWTGKTFHEKLEASLEDLLTEIGGIQKLIYQRKSQEALDSISRMEQSYPHVAYLRLLKASCYYLLGDTVRARDTLASAMQEDPNSQLGKALDSSFKGARDLSSHSSKEGGQ